MRTAHGILLCSAQRLLTRLLLFCAPSRPVRFLPQALDLGLHLLDVTLALTGLSFHRLPSFLELPKLTPSHVELDPSLLFLSSGLGQSCARIRNLAHVSTATGRLRGGAGETCEECLEKV